MSSYPFKAVLLNRGNAKKFWWPVSSNKEDDMIVGDGIPGDKRSAEFAARCCNIVYADAIDEVIEYLNSTGLLKLDKDAIVNHLIKNV